ncbi:hypothetical protein [Amycolatopsis magusensis]|uniref:Cysteine rich repeat-containing protein n=1 Tax=Amycolatopsis magusensis TaxID=882444 RepID=A0ABS4Q1C7_9PSEU|nr:hypothetical protein [Amycolatopsis magusensis]MBP2185478.1 hypothetical protein [Amycolatopsis magusensis]MDI5976086.1 hypothetical protein [Amycolatopsis magusensis]
MNKYVARALTVAAVLMSTCAVAPVAAASVEDCVERAVAAGANEHLAAFACHEDTLTSCYRIFRDNYGIQQWALEACRARTD